MHHLLRQRDKLAGHGFGVNGHDGDIKLITVDTQEDTVISPIAAWEGAINTLPGLTPGAERPMPKAARTNSTSSTARRRPQTPAPTAQIDMPSHAEIATTVASMWMRVFVLEETAANLRRAGKPDEGKAHDMASSLLSDQIDALQDFATFSTPKTPADVVGHLMMIHGKLHALGAEHLTERGDRVLKPLLLALVRSMAALSETCSFDLAGLAEHYFTPDEVKVARGEVPA